ncbi:S8 family serine peptidase [Nocardia terpenica]|uniref:S8 family serine peptidase n=1 Tax=Nocardia terpenica TaxID=455432 RepID=A0A6G9ZBK7_9NOCA|nr:S8 family serine peptidase [Nocardia terpenica]QIS22536.1 S8 family serine peptidase [Nocardia terpenica]
MRVVLQLRPAADMIAAAVDPTVRLAPSDVVSGDLSGFDLDHGYEPVAVPQRMGIDDSPAYSLEPQHASVVIRGEIGDDHDRVIAALLQSGAVTGVFADPAIQPVLTCGGSPAVGTWHDVESRLHVTDLAAAGLNGTGVALAIVDTGINAAQVDKVRGGNIGIDAKRSWNPQGVTGTAGQFPVDHGSMCAFDAMIAAPSATFLDIPVLRSTRQGGSTMDGMLSDALAAYAHLRTVLADQPQATRALVVSNSWGMFSPEWDYPVGQPGNYSDNPNHPFNVIVGSLESAGADILFAAGNCGRDCPDSRCNFPNKPITGANSHPDVLSIGGVDINDQRVGYSSQGPGRLADRKPDVCTYTHYLGSTVFGATDPDTGTSAACPTAAGLIAALRTKYSAAAVPPAKLRSIVQQTAKHHGTTDFDYDYGYGVAEAAGILGQLRQAGVRA